MLPGAARLIFSIPKVLELEKKYDRQFKVVFDTVRQLMTPPPEPHLCMLPFVFLNSVKKENEVSNCQLF